MAHKSLYLTLILEVPLENTYVGLICLPVVILSVGQNLTATFFIYGTEREYIFSLYFKNGPASKLIWWPMHTYTNTELIYLAKEKY